jgi:CelD/BcsL family acetyltransferase involved in cellulose biosynthesis
LTGLHIEVLEDASAFDALRDEWDDLLERSDASVFQSWEWLSSCRRHLSPRHGLYIVAVRDNSRLLGLAPMETTLLGPGMRRLRFIGTGPTDYLDFILDRERAGEVLSAILEHLGSSGRPWAALDLQQVPEESLTWRRWRDWRPQGFVTRDVVQEVCPFLPMEDTWEATVSKRRRSNLSYYRRLAERECDASFATVKAEELPEALEALFRLHAARWRRRKLPGVLAGSRKQAFHREVAALAQARGWLRLYAARFNGRYESLLYCLVWRDRSYYYMGGWNPDLARYSLGTVLTGLAVRDTLLEGRAEFDFLRGDEAYKSAWTSRRRSNRRLTAFPRTAAGRAAALVCGLEHELERRGKAWLHRRLDGPASRG